MSNRNLNFLSYPNKEKQVIERRCNTPCPRSIKQLQFQHGTTQVGLKPNMKTLTTCILLTLSAAAVHCMPLAEVTAADEALAEVWKLCLFFLCLYIYTMCVLNKTKAGAYFHDKHFIFFVAELSEEVLQPDPRSRSILQTPDQLFQPEAQRDAEVLWSPDHRGVG